MCESVFYWPETTCLVSLCSINKVNRSRTMYLLLTFSHLVRNLCLVFRTHTDLPLVCQKGLLHRVEHQRVEETVLDRCGEGYSSFYLHLLF